MKFVQTIQQNIIQQHLLEKDKKYLVDLSGGETVLLCCWYFMNWVIP